MAQDSDTFETQLGEQFRALAKSLKATDDTAQRWTDAFLARYREPQRHYHTLWHVHSMLNCLKVIKYVPQDSNAFLLAIFFHDWIYDPTRTDNEEQSIDEFHQFAVEAALRHDLRERVKYLIRLTITHTVPQTWKWWKRDKDAERFLDFDLAVLTWGFGSYETYAQQIRQEYSHYSDEEYRKGRIKVLNSFLQRKRLFYSEASRLEERIARKNMMWEIEHLEKEGLVGA